MTSALPDLRLDDAAQAVAELAHGRSVSAAESCTAGRIVAALAGVERATEFLRGGLIAYQEHVKRSVLGVRTPTVLCEEAAAEMARGVATFLAADVAVATTGVAGTDPVDGVEPGTVFVATFVDRTMRTTTLHLDAAPREVCDRASEWALRLLADHLGERGRV